MSENIIEMRNVAFGFASSDRILSDVSLTIGRSERVALMGPSGSGKTTLLKIMAGISNYRQISGSYKNSGYFAMLFQQSLLIDHLTVIENIRLPSIISGCEYTNVGALETLGLVDLLDRYPYQLSGGQQRRVAMARALSYPDVTAIIMDEPFSGLDELSRDRAARQLQRELDGAELACVMSTHSPYEACLLASRVLILSGTPAQISHDYTIKVKVDRSEDPMAQPEFVQAVRNLSLMLRELSSGGHDKVNL